MPPQLILLSACGIASLAVGLGLCWKAARGEVLVPVAPRRPVPWNAGHIALVLIYLLGPLILAHLQLPLADDAAEPMEMTADGLVWALLFVSVAGVIVVSVTLAACRLAGATWRDLGWRPDKAASDVSLGVTAFLALAAPIYLLQWWLTLLYPSQHPIIELLSTHRDSLHVMLCLVSGVLIAPIAEEMMFRLFLQGWLQRVAAMRGPPRETVAGSDAHSSPTAPAAVSTTSDHGELASAVEENPYAPPQEANLLEPTKADGDEFIPARTYWLPILASSLLFAALHDWPDQVPLFLLAIALGWIYQRTHRILPCIVLHACLNLTSLGLFLLGLD
jgi:membrane protease YdiL (CAAX protease family)